MMATVGLNLNPHRILAEQVPAAQDVFEKTEEQFVSPCGVDKCRRSLRPGHPSKLVAMRMMPSDGGPAVPPLRPPVFLCGVVCTKTTRTE